MHACVKKDPCDRVSLPATSHDAHVTSTIFLQPTDAAEICSLICKLKNDAAAGNDGIKPGPIKHVVHEISDVLAYIINLTISTGILPD